MADLQISANMEQAAHMYDMAVFVKLGTPDLTYWPATDDEYYFMWEWLEVEDFSTHFGYILH